MWHPGENALKGRDHTIHAAVEGYVKYYRDPQLHPTRQYIGVAFNRDDTLPYPKDAPRRRKLGMVAVTRKVHEKKDKKSLQERREKEHEKEEHEKELKEEKKHEEEEKKHEEEERQRKKEEKELEKHDLPTKEDVDRRRD